MLDDFKNKCSERMKGNTINNGRKHTDSTKLARSLTTSGQLNPMYGKKHTKDSLNLISTNFN
jgi:hypothetical protein